MKAFPAVLKSLPRCLSVYLAHVPSKRLVFMVPVNFQDSWNFQVLGKKENRSHEAGCRCYELSRIHPLKTRGRDYTVGRLTRSGYFQEQCIGDPCHLLEWTRKTSEQWVCCSLEFPLRSCWHEGRSISLPCCFSGSLKWREINFHLQSCLLRFRRSAAFSLSPLLVCSFLLSFLCPRLDYQRLDWNFPW